MPLALFADDSVRESMGVRELAGHYYELFSFRYGKHRIWGATARIMDQLIQTLSISSR